MSLGDDQRKIYAGMTVLRSFYSAAYHQVLRFVLLIVLEGESENVQFP
jgi:hypothetical protein